MLRHNLFKTIFVMIFAAAMLALPNSALTSEIGRQGKDKKDNYDLTGFDISSSFRKFMKCNAGKLNLYECNSDLAAQSLLFDYAAVEKLRNYHVIMIPGGDYDFFSELETLCEGGPTEDLEDFFEAYPVLGLEIKNSMEKEVCPGYQKGEENSYDKFMDAFISYEMFLGSNDIAFTRLQFSKDLKPLYVGDRLDKVTLLANTIDTIEAEFGDNVTGYKKNYIIMGHSFGGLNIADFLVELLGGHTPGTPEDKLFETSSVRAWPIEKKERIFKKIKAIALINSFVQGGRSAEITLQKLAEEQNIQTDDPVVYYINYVLANYNGESFDPNDLAQQKIYQGVLRSNRYRVDYYLADKNSTLPKSGTPVKDAYDRIATEIAVLAVGCWVPRILPDFFVQPNYLVKMSKKKWREEGILNDGLVETYSSIIPRPSVDYLFLPNLDHGALVLKPQVRGISIGQTYDDMPFIKTLFKRISTKMPEIEGNLIQ